MAIVRVAERPRYTVVDNRPIEDPALSFRALGLLVYLLSKPDHWEVSYRHLATVKAEGQHAVRATLAELETAGYLVRERRHLPGGRFEWVSTIYESPCGGERGMGERGLGGPRREDRGEVTTDRATTDSVRPDGGAPPLSAGSPGDRDPGAPDTLVPRATAAANVDAARRARALLAGEAVAPDDALVLPLYAVADAEAAG